jgi:hypothetical protein
MPLSLSKVVTYDPYIERRKSRVFGSKSAIINFLAMGQVRGFWKKLKLRYLGWPSFSRGIDRGPRVFAWNFWCNTSVLNFDATPLTWGETYHHMRPTPCERMGQVRGWVCIGYFFIYIFPRGRDRAKREIEYYACFLAIRARVSKEN